MPAAPGAVADDACAFERAPGQVESVDEAGGGDDGGAVLVVVKHRHVHALAQTLLDDEALRRLDVLEIDPAPALAEEAPRS